MSRNWSTYQLNVFDHIENKSGNIIIKAVAGSGKSTTIEEADRRVPGSSVFLAFNKAIAEELKSRGVNAKTFHSLTFMIVTRHIGTSNVNSNKLQNILSTNLKSDVNFMYGRFIMKLVSLAKQVGIGCLLPDVEANYHAIIEHHDLELDNENADMDTAVELAMKLLKWSNESPMIDFDDLLYIPVKDNLVLPKFDFVFVDEAQDTNNIQRALIRKILKPTSRIIAVGDPKQAIYGFRGASSNSMDLIADEFQCDELPLTTSYRCAKSIVEFAQRWCGYIEAHENAPEGEVINMGSDWHIRGFDKSDLIVCRTTKPLVQLAYQFLKANIPARLLGREIGQALISLVNKLKAGNIEDLIAKLNIYTQREVERATREQKEVKAAAIQDKTDALMCLIEGLDENSRFIDTLISTINHMFSDLSNAVTLSTIHKAKGLEADTVWWLNSSKCPAKWAKMDWQVQQEENLCYVAATRAKTTLRLIEERGTVSNAGMEALKRTINAIGDDNGIG